MGRSTTGIGIAQLYMYNFDTASILFHKALTIAKENDPKGAEALILNNLGRLHKRKKEYQRAINYINESNMKLLAAGMKKSYARGKCLLAEIELVKKNYKQALEIADSSLLISEDLKDYQNIIRVKTVIANLNAEIGNISLANQQFQEVMAIGSKLNIKMNLIAAMIDYFRFLIDQQKYRQADSRGGSL